MRSTDRILKLAKIEGKHTISSKGLVDNRIFTGDNNLHAYMEPNGLWALSYDKGIVEPALRVKFTNFPTLMKFVKDYYHRRNIRIEEIED